MRYVLSIKGSKCAKMKTDVKFKISSASYVKFYPKIEENEEKNSGSHPRWGVCPSRQKCARIKTDVKYENIRDSRNRRE